MIHYATARPTSYGQVYSVSALFTGDDVLFFYTVDRINRTVTRTWKHPEDGDTPSEASHVVDGTFERFVSDLENSVDTCISRGSMNSLVRVDHYSLISDLNAMSACEEGAA